MLCGIVHGQADDVSERAVAKQRRIAPVARDRFVLSVPLRGQIRTLRGQVVEAGMCALASTAWAALAARAMPRRGLIPVAGRAKPPHPLLGVTGQHARY